MNNGNWYKQDWGMLIITLICFSIYIGGIIYIEYNKVEPEDISLSTQQKLWTLEKKRDKLREVYMYNIGHSIDIMDAENINPDTLKYYFYKGQQAFEKAKIYDKDIDSLSHVIDSIENFPR